MKPIMWFTGLPSSGKTTRAGWAKEILENDMQPVCLLDGDDIRKHENSHLGFDAEGRDMQVRHVITMAQEAQAVGKWVVIAVIAPFAYHRVWASVLDDVHWCYVGTPLDECRLRDEKGLYRASVNGNLKNLTGVDSPYDVPVNADLQMSGGDADKALLESWIQKLIR